jgi:serine-type D-Ala-D-Ala carboxypeptidase (penicillin-binding protein 5/6)
MPPSLLNNRRLARRGLLLAGIFLPAAAIAQTAPKPKHPVAKPAPAARPGVPKKTAEAEPVISGPPANTPLGPLDTEAKYAIIVDFNSGATLLDKDADVPQVPSSLTKMMTAYIVYEHLKKGSLSLTQELPVSEKAWRMQGSKMFVAINSSVKVEDLIRGMIVQSGNDACIVLAEGIAGSEEQFVELMNAKAREFGLTNTVFMNCTGWPDPGHHMSVRDIATVARRLIADFPEYYHYDAEKTFKYNNIEQGNRNTLVQKGVADGLKTGHTDEGGYGIAVSAQRGNRRVIVVLNGLPTMHARGEEGERLLDWAFASFENVQLFAAGDVVEQAPVWLGAQPTVPLVGGRDVVLTMPRNWRNKANISIDYDSPIPAPIIRGTRLGTLTVAGDGVPNIDMPLLAGADVQKLGLAGRSMAVLNRMLAGS